MIILLLFLTLLVTDLSSEMQLPVSDIKTMRGDITPAPIAVPKFAYIKDISVLTDLIVTTNPVVTQHLQGVKMNLFNRRNVVVMNTSLEPSHGFSYTSFVLSVGQCPQNLKYLAVEFHTTRMLRQMKFPLVVADFTKLGKKRETIAEELHTKQRQIFTLKPPLVETEIAEKQRKTTVVDYSTISPSFNLSTLIFFASKSHLLETEQTHEPTGSKTEGETNSKSSFPLCPRINVLNGTVDASLTTEIMKLLAADFKDAPISEDVSSDEPDRRKVIRLPSSETSSNIYQHRKQERHLCPRINTLNETTDVSLTNNLKLLATDYRHFHGQITRNELVTKTDNVVSKQRQIVSLCPRINALNETLDVSLATSQLTSEMENGDVQGNIPIPGETLDSNGCGHELDVNGTSKTSSDHTEWVQSISKTPSTTSSKVNILTDIIWMNGLKVVHLQGNVTNCLGRRNIFVSACLDGMLCLKFSHTTLSVSPTQCPGFPTTIQLLSNKLQNGQERGKSRNVNLMKEKADKKKAIKTSQELLKTFKHPVCYDDNRTSIVNHPISIDPKTLNNTIMKDKSLGKITSTQELIEQSFCHAENRTNYVGHSIMPSDMAKRMKDQEILTGTQRKIIDQEGKVNVSIQKFGKFEEIGDNWMYLETDYAEFHNVENSMCPILNGMCPALHNASTDLRAVFDQHNTMVDTDLIPAEEDGFNNVYNNSICPISHNSSIHSVENLVCSVLNMTCPALYNVSLDPVRCSKHGCNGNSAYYDYVGSSLLKQKGPKNLDIYSSKETSLSMQETPDKIDPVANTGKPVANRDMLQKKHVPTVVNNNDKTSSLTSDYPYDVENDIKSRMKNEEQFQAPPTDVDEKTKKSGKIEKVLKHKHPATIVSNRDRTTTWMTSQQPATIVNNRDITTTRMTSQQPADEHERLMRRNKELQALLAEFNITPVQPFRDFYAESIAEQEKAKEARYAREQGMKIDPRHELNQKLEKKPLISVPSENITVTDENLHDGDPWKSLQTTLFNDASESHRNFCRNNRFEWVILKQCFNNDKVWPEHQLIEKKYTIVRKSQVGKLPDWDSPIRDLSVEELPYEKSQSAKVPLEESSSMELPVSESLIGESQFGEVPLEKSPYDELSIRQSPVFGKSEHFQSVYHFFGLLNEQVSDSLDTTSSSTKDTSRHLENYSNSTMGESNTAFHPVDKVDNETVFQQPVTSNAEDAGHHFYHQNKITEADRHNQTIETLSKRVEELMGFLEKQRDADFIDVQYWNEVLADVAEFLARHEVLSSVAVQMVVTFLILYRWKQNIALELQIIQLENRKNVQRMMEQMRRVEVKCDIKPNVVTMPHFVMPPTTHHVPSSECLNIEQKEQLKRWQDKKEKKKLGPPSLLEKVLTEEAQNLVGNLFPQNQEKLVMSPNPLSQRAAKQKQHKVRSNLDDRSEVVKVNAEEQAIINQLFHNPQKQQDAYPLHKHIKTRMEAMLSYRPNDQFRKTKTLTTPSGGITAKSKVKQKNQSIAQKLAPVRTFAPSNHLLVTGTQNVDGSVAHTNINGYGAPNNIDRSVALSNVDRAVASSNEDFNMLDLYC